MTGVGWLIFIISNAIVVGLCIFCLIRIFILPRQHLHAPLDIDTHDIKGEEIMD